MLTLSPYLATGLVLAAFGAALAFLQHAQRRLQAHPELPRKALHVAMGAAALAFPYLFDAPGPVIVLGLATTAILLLLRHRGIQCRGTAQVVHGIERCSYGDLCFPAAILATFCLADGDARAFMLPIALLAFADPAAALVGLRGGRRYRVTDTWKTWRGSAAFAGVALCLTLPTLPLGAALLVAAAATVLEGIAWRGLDNLLIPVGAWLALALTGHAEAGPLDLVAAGALLVLAGLLPLVASRTTRRRRVRTSRLGAAGDRRANPPMGRTDEHHTTSADPTPR